MPARGHLDKIAEQISDAILEVSLRQGGQQDGNTVCGDKAEQ